MPLGRKVRSAPSCWGSERLKLEIGIGVGNEVDHLDASAVHMCRMSISKSPVALQCGFSASSRHLGAPLSRMTAPSLTGKAGQGSQGPAGSTDQHPGTPVEIYFYEQTP